MKKSKHRNVKIENDFRSVTWTKEHEAAFQLLSEGAYTLQMTVGEFADVLDHSDRECPKCKAGQH